jgi:flagellar FliJ protein
MKMFEFSLHRLLNTREALEKAMEVKLGQHMRRVELGRRRAQGVREQRNQEARVMEAMTGQCSPGHDLAMRVNYFQWLDQEVARQDENVRRLEKEAELVRQEWVEAMKERKSLEQLKEKERRGWLLNARRHEQKDQDEVSSVMFFRRHQEA